MKNVLIILSVLFGYLFLMPDFSYAQSTDSTAVTNDQVVGLATTEIKIKIETPQVKLFSSRIKPEFDDIHLEKSFSKEIIGSGETFVFSKPLTSKPTTRIDIEKVLKKIR